MAASGPTAEWEQYLAALHAQLPGSHAIHVVWSIAPECSERTHCVSRVNGHVPGEPATCAGIENAGHSCQPIEAAEKVEWQEYAVLDRPGTSPAGGAFSRSFRAFHSSPVMTSAL